MAQKDYTQGELFAQSEDSGLYRPQPWRNPFFLRIRNYEKAMLLVMGIVILSIITFSLGVEKGKRSALAEINSSGQDFYTIQVAAFKNRKLALRQAQVLQKSGYTPLGFAKGNYIILCVGKFANQESAQPLLVELQRTYAKCRIRRL